MKINKFISDSFLMILSSGIAQIILIVTTPIITRLYSPAEFGEFTIFSNIAMILIPIINARYDLLIVNAKMIVLQIYFHRLAFNIISHYINTNSSIYG